MKSFSRRTFIKTLPGLAIGLSGFKTFLTGQEKKAMIMSVLGPVDPLTMGAILPHEHILVDFIGAKVITADRWNKDEVMDKVLPFLDELKMAGCNTLIDCTPNYLGRDVDLLKELSQTAKINIITNTGYYGGSDHKFLPDHAFTETAEALASRWAGEHKFGIDKTRIKPGFIKISVNPGPLSDISKKLITAASITHLRTGLTIASHTGPATPAFEQIEILKKAKIDPSAFIWVHAQNEKDKSNFVKAAKEGAWISLDGVRDGNVQEYVDLLTFLKKENCLLRTLISHDAGWYEPGKPGAGEFRGYTSLFKKLLPALRQQNFSENEILQLIRINPINAFTIAVKRLRKR
jgi:phosphotriesterase-related protein